MNLIFEAVKWALAVIAFFGTLAIGFVVIMGLSLIVANVIDKIHDVIWWRL